jgi:hypothetical protein
MADKGKKQRTAELPAGNINIWELLQAEFKPLGERPDNSVTPEEFAAKMGISIARAHQQLRASPKLKAVEFRSPGGKRAKCYVPAGAKS